MKNTMKKFLAVVLILLMTVPSMAFAASAAIGEYTLYNLAENGDVLYEMDFRGTTGFFTLIDGRGAAWNNANAVASSDGSSMTLTYTTNNTDGNNENKSRARTSGNIESFSTVGTAYTVEFTVDSLAPVCVSFDGGGGFVVAPDAKWTSIGRYGNWTRIGSKENYEGGVEGHVQTYAVEISFPETKGTCIDGDKSYEGYIPDVYKLYILDDAGKYTLIREMTVDQAVQNGWIDENGPNEEGEEWFYFEFAFIRYNDSTKTDSETGEPIMTTVSNLTVKKGIDVIEKNEITPPVEDENGGEDEGENNENNENNENGGNVNVTPETFAPPTAVTEEPETEVETEVPAKKAGCGSSLALSGLTLVTVCATGFAVKRAKKKED